MKRLLLILLVGLLNISPAQAGNLLMARTYQKVEVTLEAVKQAVESRGYTVAHEQRCDGGLTDMGYTTDLYRVVFFGKGEEVRHWSSTHPEMIPYLPLKIAVFAEGDQVLVVSFNPEELGQLFTDRKLKIQFSRWKSDIESVLAEVSEVPEAH